MNNHRRRRSGFTIMETAIALALLAFVMVLVAQLGTWTLAERVRAEERLAAIEGVANVLEAARARPWKDLTPDWAAEQKLTSDLADRLHEAVLTVRVEPEPDRPRIKRVTVQLGWTHGDGATARTAAAVALLAERGAGS
jgi:type II secretory pathway pseudopilin PulG